jgi:23S rRNA (adenine2030-N6)-methyltransferase
MNYRHAFHAGNFADVIKHTVLARILAHLAAKPAPFRVIDTHAGSGIYDLTGAEASRGGEWQGGIGHLIDAPLQPDLSDLLAPYLAVVRSLNSGDRLTAYPGSPAIARACLRPSDRLIVCELEPQASRLLSHHFDRDRRVKAIAIDGWTALNAYVPPKERRGLVLVDPPFEEAGEFMRLAQGFAAAHRKWPSGIYVLWYQLKDRAAADQFASDLRGTGINKLMRIEFGVAPVRAGERLSACGLVIANPPWPLEAEMQRLLPTLAGRLAPDGRGNFQIDWLAGES